MICYLCGNAIHGESTRDHVPPKQFFAPQIRRQFGLYKLVTLPAHESCNSLYKKDEEYTVYVMSVAAHESPTGKAVFDHNKNKAAQGQAVGLQRKLLGALDERPGGLWLPDNKVLLRIEGDRVKRVIWKIIRGLYYLRFAAVLPSNTPFVIDIREPENKAPSSLDYLWDTVRAEGSQGEYQAIFAHKHFMAETEGLVIHGWAMLWWDRIIVYCAHWDPGLHDESMPRRHQPATV